MPGTWFGLEIAKRGTMVHRKAMDVTGHNIANASTEGYSRQEAVIKATDAWTLPSLETKMLPGQLGTGSEVAQVRRIRDYYLDVQIRNSNSYEGYWQKKLDMANQTETVFLEPDGRGLQATMLDFFNDWQDLNNNPQDAGVKKAVKESADELANIFRQMHSQLTNIGKSVDDSLAYQVGQVNEIATKIKDLSNTIAHVMKNDAQPNDLLDQRDKLLDELSTYGAINVTAGNNGLITVSFINSSAVLISNDGSQASASELSLITPTNTGNDEYHLAVDGVDTINLTALANYSSTTAADGAARGSILGQESARLENDNVIKKLDILAKSFIAQINEKSGLPGVTASASVTKPFTFFTGTGAADIALGQEVASNPEVIIGENALAVAQLSSTPIRNLTGTIDLRNGITFDATNIDKTKFTITLPSGETKDIDLQTQGGLSAGFKTFSEIKTAIQTALNSELGSGEVTVGDDGLGHLVLTANNGDGAFSIEADATNDILFGGKSTADPTKNAITVYVLDTTFENYYQSIVAQVGANVDHHDNMLANQQAIGDQIETLRQSVSGVSLDEELTKVIQFQYGYQACARMISMQDEMLDYLINRIK